ncbi:hypothetical protein GA0061103_4683 [Rhizobium multihospitium]|uniref:Uncharacterized protein n=1 Tax=Rhizobium multihospitium TaxID=410764 RepID=A0A1C3W1G5_9HYPH|nr:hypothetical protein GA0061103_4683 [Rhizobium multihospitium]
MRFRQIAAVRDPALLGFGKPVARGADFATLNERVKRTGMRSSRLPTHGYGLSRNKRIDDRMIERFSGRAFVADAPFCKNIPPLSPRLGTALSTVVQ